MSGKNKSSGKATTHIDRARPVLPTGKRTDAEKVAATRTTTPSIQASPNWAQSVDEQAAVASWNQHANVLEA